MNYYYVPDFDMDEDYSSIPTSTRPKKLPVLGDPDEIMELLWENGQPIVQSQNQRSFTRRPLIEGDAVTPPDRREIRSSSHPNESGLNNDHLFVQEDEMAFWLHQYAPVEATDEMYSDMIDHSAAAPGPESVASRVAGSTVEVSGGAAEGGDGEPVACELTSSSGGSASLDPVTVVDRKRKGRKADDDSEFLGEDVEFESPDAKKQIRGSTPAKKSRAAEVHNLSERRRRDRINEKMRALQELIPRCNKSDKASMLDEAIEYLKSLQLQVQMMSMGCSMFPMMFPGVQQYIPPRGMAMGMGMGMGMEMAMSRPMFPFPSVLAGSALPTPTAATHMGPRFPVPAFHMPSVPLPSPSNQSDPILKSLSSQNRNQPRMMNIPGPYHQYLGLHHTQLPLLQNQAMMHPSTTKPSNSREG